MHSIEYNYAPPSLLGIWTKNYITRGDRPLRNADNYTLPNPRTELFKKSPLYTLPLEWNMLDENRYIRNRTTFKTALKYMLLNSVIDGIEPLPAIVNWLINSVRMLVMVSRLAPPHIFFMQLLHSTAVFSASRMCRARTPPALPRPLPLPRPPARLIGPGCHLSILLPIISRAPVVWALHRPQDENIGLSLPISWLPFTILTLPHSLCNLISLQLLKNYHS